MILKSIDIPGIEISSRVSPSTTVQPGVTIRATFELIFSKTFHIKSIFALFKGIERVNVKGRVKTEKEGEALARIAGKEPKMTKAADIYEEISPSMTGRSKKRVLTLIRQDLLPSLLRRGKHSKDPPKELIIKAGSKKTLTISFVVPHKLPPTASYGDIAVIEYALKLKIVAHLIDDSSDEVVEYSSPVVPPPSSKFKSSYTLFHLQGGDDIGRYIVPITMLSSSYLTGSFPRIAESGLYVAKEFKTLLGSKHIGEIVMTTGLPNRIFHPLSRIPIRYDITNTSGRQLGKITVKLKQRVSMWTSPVHRWQEVTNISKTVDETLAGKFECSGTIVLDIPPLFESYDAVIVSNSSKTQLQEFNKRRKARELRKNMICQFAEQMKRVMVQVEQGKLLLDTTEGADVDSKTQLQEFNKRRKARELRKNMICQFAEQMKRVMVQVEQGKLLLDTTEGADVESSGLSDIEEERSLAGDSDAGLSSDLSSKIKSVQAFDELICEDDDDIQECSVPTLAFAEEIQPSQPSQVSKEDIIIKQSSDDHPVEVIKEGILKEKDPRQSVDASTLNPTKTKLFPPLPDLDRGEKEDEQEPEGKEDKDKDIIDEESSVQSSLSLTSISTIPIYGKSAGHVESFKTFMRGRTGSCEDNLWSLAELGASSPPTSTSSFRLKGRGRSRGSSMRLMCVPKQDYVDEDELESDDNDITKLIIKKLSLAPSLDDTHVLSMLADAKRDGKDVSMSAVTLWQQNLCQLMKDEPDPFAPSIAVKKKGDFSGLSVSLPSLEIVGDFYGVPTLEYDPLSDRTTVTKQSCYSKGAVSAWYLVDHEVRVYLTIKGGFQKCLQVGLPVLVTLRKTP
ncbi:hypothetical protein ADUPG1_000167 [Aduncisulcus paluster]|uniref:Arrestin C-terminal-like domain-containing protein n=1 Tax=Aduncisulcus paluster TaxID=2918883 RepID=A0ABQ5K5A1_9EUKA|nr:hypothetical protein ADUPG1_000167 [Aduncisulcus paluster]